MSHLSAIGLRSSVTSSQHRFLRGLVATKKRKMALIDLGKDRLLWQFSMFGFSILLTWKFHD